MNNRLVTWAPLLMLLLLAALTWWLDSKVQPPVPKRDGSSRHDPDYIVENFAATRMSTNGTPRYILTAKKMMHYPDDDTTYLESPVFRYVEEGKPEINISANQALLTSGGEDAFFTGDVTVVRQAWNNDPELKAFTSFLHVIPDQDLAKTDKPVTLTEQRSIVTAVGLELNSATRVLKLLSNVKGHYENPR
ncbi:MAG TPA: LPS export ABC transporter periplasmic protein LptC [Burkholderiales bacterium]|nr:LPS export ABC transporter periplasmic protein LptC [Burkholderiales bacterium]